MHINGNFLLQIYGSLFLQQIVRQVGCYLIFVLQTRDRTLWYRAAVSS